MIHCIFYPYIQSHKSPLWFSPWPPAWCPQPQHPPTDIVSPLNMSKPSQSGHELSLSCTHSWSHLSSSRLKRNSASWALQPLALPPVFSNVFKPHNIAALTTLLYFYHTWHFSPPIPTFFQTLLHLFYTHYCSGTIILINWSHLHSLLILTVTFPFSFTYLYSFFYATNLHSSLVQYMPPPL